MELGLICYMDSWVTHNTFLEQNNQNKQINCIYCKTALFYNTFELAFLPIPSDFECIIHVYSLEAMKYHD